MQRTPRGGLKVPEASAGRAVSGAVDSPTRRPWASPGPVTEPLPPGGDRSRDGPSQGWHPACQGLRFAVISRRAERRPRCGGGVFVAREDGERRCLSRGEPRGVVTTAAPSACPRARRWSVSVCTPRPPWPPSLHSVPTPPSPPPSAQFGTKLCAPSKPRASPDVRVAVAPRLWFEARWRRGDCTLLRGWSPLVRWPPRRSPVPTAAEPGLASVPLSARLETRTKESLERASCTVTWIETAVCGEGNIVPDGTPVPTLPRGGRGGLGLHGITGSEVQWTGF